MKSNKYKTIICFCCLIFFAKKTTAQTANLQMIGSLNCENNIYCNTIQIQAADNNNFKIGTSSIYFTYNTTALAFKNYVSLHFDGTDLCDNGTTSVWETHAFDTDSLAGTFNLTLLLNSDGNACPTIDNTQWIDIGEICFDVLDNSQNPQLAFNEVNTNFNSDSPNDGSQAIAKGVFSGIDTATALAQISENCGENCSIPCLNITVTRLNN